MSLNPVTCTVSGDKVTLVFQVAQTRPSATGKATLVVADAVPVSVKGMSGSIAVNGWVK